MTDPQAHPLVSSQPQSTAPDPHGNHITVLREPAVEALQPTSGGIYIDGTFGGGGHTRLLLEQEPPIGLVLAIDADLDAGPRARRLADLPQNRGRLRLYHRNFRDLVSVVENAAVPRVDGVLLDLGLSSFQLDQGERGFSFRRDAPLDMRFDQTGGVTAAELVNTADASELARILWLYGEEKQSRRIAAAIVREREKVPIRTTGELASLVERTVGGRRRSPIHPATRTFQALRIEVNAELDALSDVLRAATTVLAPGGRLVVIAFHSLEDRIVKRFIEAESRTCVCPPDQPICTCDTIPRLRRIGKPIRPSEDEMRFNPRSRSAIMRVAERLDRGGNVAHRGSSE
ncbi:MAG: 16S rRNA (cytosine(1402)-N(4))-methyltransferase RsmH [Chloroflexota bacterium]|nr:16S rRNA (cytosine(1402)-N(4))-methyltransferase RsmH [Chloroflexota bacterium]